MIFRIVKWKPERNFKLNNFPFTFQDHIYLNPVQWFFNCYKGTVRPSERWLVIAILNRLANEARKHLKKKKC
jgi:hypothetical protein